MGGAPPADLNHRVVIELPGPQDGARFNQFRKALQGIVSEYGGKVVEELKTKKKSFVPTPTKNEPEAP